MECTTIGERPCLTDAATTVCSTFAARLVVETAAEVARLNRVVAATPVAAVAIGHASPVVGRTRVLGAAMHLPTVRHRPCFTNAAATVRGTVAPCLKGKTTAEVDVRDGVIATTAVAAISVGGTRIALGGAGNTLTAAMQGTAVGDRPRFAGATAAIGVGKTARLIVETATEGPLSNRVVATLPVATVRRLRAVPVFWQTHILSTAAQGTAVGDRPCLTNTAATVGVGNTRGFKA